MNNGILQVSLKDSRVYSIKQVSSINQII